jgi:mRNA interferase MazF
MKQRGEVWWVNFDPSVGSETRKQRLAVVVSNDVANKHLKRYQVVPLTSRVDKIYPGEALITFEGKPSKAMCDQLTTVSERRFLNKAGQLGSVEMKWIEAAIKTQLDLK